MKKSENRLDLQICYFYSTFLYYINKNYLIDNYTPLIIITHIYKSIILALIILYLSLVYLFNKRGRIPTRKSLYCRNDFEINLLRVFGRKTFKKTSRWNIYASWLFSPAMPRYSHADLSPSPSPPSSLSISLSFSQNIWITCILVPIGLAAREITEICKRGCS